MDRNIIFFLIALLVAIYQIIKERKNSKKLKKQLQDINENIVLPSSRLKKAMEYYEKGDYVESLEVFESFSNDNNKGSSVMLKAIRKIFWSETENIFVEEYINAWKPELIVFLVMQRNGLYKGKYSSYLFDLLELYESTFEKPASCFKAVFYMVNRDFEKLCIDSELKSLNPTTDNNSNEFFRSCVKSYCCSKCDEA